MNGKIIAIVVIAVLLGSMGASLAHGEVKADTWWNSAWKYKRAITISSQEVLNGYQLSLNISYNGHMRADFGDLRFTYYNTSAGAEESIPYWIESKVNGAWARVWVKVPHLNVGANTVYMYYGNPGAGSESNPDTTMSFYENFSSNPDNKFWIYRYNNDTANEGVWNSENGNFYLTTSEYRMGCMAFMKYHGSMAHGFYVHFRYMIGGGDGADGIAFAFYKDMRPYEIYKRVTSGGDLALSANSDGSMQISPGYAVELDTYLNNFDPYRDYVGITDTFSTPLPSAHYGTYETNKVDDGHWHSMDIYFSADTSHICVFLDNEKIIDLTGVPFAKYGCNYTGFGFGGATGDSDDNHIIDDVILTEYTDKKPTYILGKEVSQKASESAGGSTAGGGLGNYMWYIIIGVVAAAVTLVVLLLLRRRPPQAHITQNYSQENYENMQGDNYSNR